MEHGDARTERRDMEEALFSETDWSGGSGHTGLSDPRDTQALWVPVNKHPAENINTIEPQNDLSGRKGRSQ